MIIGERSLFRVLSEIGIEVTIATSRNRAAVTTRLRDKKTGKKPRATEASAQARPRAVTRTRFPRRRVTAPGERRRGSEGARGEPFGLNGISSAYRVSVHGRACTSSAVRDVPVSRAVIPRGRGKWRGVRCGVTTQSSRPKGERFVYSRCRLLFRRITV